MVIVGSLLVCRATLSGALGLVGVSSWSRGLSDVNVEFRCLYGFLASGRGVYRLRATLVLDASWFARSSLRSSSLPIVLAWSPGVAGSGIGVGRHEFWSLFESGSRCLT
jgi:hypothetical protein